MKHLLPTFALTALCGLGQLASAQQPAEREVVKAFFLESLTQQQDATQSREAFIGYIQQAPVCDKPLKLQQLTSYQQMVWQAWRDANSDFSAAESQLIALTPLAQGNSSQWQLPEALEPSATMPYYWGRKGDTTEPLPLYLYLHGSGDKEREWATGLVLAQRFADAPSIYFVPQIPNTGAYYRWWQLAKQYAWEKLLRQSLLSDAVDARHIYLLGISEGGYGSQRLASFYADYLAAAGPMAGGEPLKNAPVENCANIGFSFLTGADDRGFYRNILTHYTEVAFDSAQQQRPLAADGTPLFRHRVTLLPDMQHHINYDLTTPWLKQFGRNPYPKTVLWEDFEMDGRRRQGFYNLQVLKRPSEGRTYYTLDVQANTLTLSVRNVAYTTTQTDERYGIEMKFTRTYSEATGGQLRIYLCSELVDLTKPVTIVVNGREVFKDKVKPSLSAMQSSVALFADPLRIFPAAVDVTF
ncbi:MAG: hypothetical protein Q4B58_04770 [Bacteroidales bacterium]|nr:hypothetical protein [Bacteroidales bacterium]